MFIEESLNETRVMTFTQAIKMVVKMASYNMKIIFGGKFIWFFIVAFLFFCYFMFQSAYEGLLPSEEMIYNHLSFPALLLVFYPAVFGIQNDADNRILEVLFGIPNYMYKVWLVRLILIYIEIYIMLVIYACVARYLLYPVNPFEMAMQLMLPVLFIGNLAFLYSTITRNGNATAVLIIITGIVFNILSQSLFRQSMWNVFLNPFELPENLHPAIWSNIVTNNRLFLGIGCIIWVMLGLFNLQKREKFV